jgi:hypothetical protein
MTTVQRGRPPASAPATGPSVRWLLIASSWLLLVLLPNGVMAWMAFGIVAVIGRRRTWGVAAVIYAVASIVFDQVANPMGDILQGTLYLVILVHALIVNPAWLTLLWARREHGLALWGTPPRKKPAPAGPRQRAEAIPKEAEKLLAGTGTARSDYLADAPADAPRKRSSRSRRSNATSAASPPRVPATAEPTELVDVNTAGQRELSRLTGIDRTMAKALVADRTKRGGYATLEDFGTAANLKPHEIVRLRAEAFCSPRPRADRSFGRRVDF